MSKKKINKNNTLDVLNKINLKTSLESFNDSVLKKESESLDKLERERNMLINKLKK